MTTRNEKSPLTRNASGQENGTEIEARGLSVAVNGTQTEILTSRKSPAPGQASEATAARPSMEDSTAEGIVDARTAGGNETSSKVCRADALTRESIESIARKYAGAYFSGLLFQDADSFARFSDELILAAPPDEQPAAAPIDDPDLNQLLEAAALGLERAGMLDSVRIVRGLKPGYPKTAPAPADERAAFDTAAIWHKARNAWLAASRHGTQEAADAAAIAVLNEARISANETRAEGAADLAHELWSAAQLAPGEGIEHGTERIAAILSRAPAAEPVAMPDEATFQRLFIKHGGPVDGEGWCINESGLRDFLRELAAAPQPPAQADAREGLDEIRATVCAIAVVGSVDGHDVIRRASAIDLIDRRRARLQGAAQ
ncbi:TPA: hypothetical protein QDB13_000071 [Burkholderia vietnamiensis]|nr:hypothetical protein [Burkholderia vietnamiensis]